MAMGLTLEPDGGGADGGTSLKFQSLLRLPGAGGKRSGYLAFWGSIRLAKDGPEMGGKKAGFRAVFSSRASRVAARMAKAETLECGAENRVSI